MALAYVLLIIWIVINEGLHAVGLPSVVLPKGTQFHPLGYQGLRLAAFAAIALLLILPRLTHVPGQVWRLVAGASLMFGSLVLSGLLLGFGFTEFAAHLALTTAALVVAGACLTAAQLRWMLFWIGGLFAWGSVIAGVVETIGVLNLSAIDHGERYGRWLEALGLPVDDVRIGALGGLAGGRPALAGTLGMLLILQILVMKQERLGFRHYYWILGPLGCTVGLAWTISRNSLLAVPIGVGLVLVPWARIPTKRARAASFVVLIALPVVPLLALLAYNAGEPSGTWQWRLELWSQMLSQLRSSPMFGLGISTPLPLGAFHLHNLLMELLVLGGILSVVVYCVFLWIANDIAVRSAQRMAPTAMGALAVFVALGMAEMPIAFRSPVFTQRWIILLLALAAAASALARHTSTTATEPLDTSSQSEDTPAHVTGEAQGELPFRGADSLDSTTSGVR